MQPNVLSVLFTLTLTVMLTIPQIMPAHLGQHNLGQHHRGQPPGRMGNSGMGRGSDAQTIHQLFANHTQIRRTVEEIPGGIHAVTESDDAEVAALIQTHVSRMYDRVTAQRGIPMMGMSSTLPTMVQAASQYQRHLQMTPKGIEVTETSNDPEIIAVIREHAQEVTQFAEQGMPAMMNGRM